MNHWTELPSSTEIAPGPSQRAGPASSHPATTLRSRTFATTTRAAAVAFISLTLAADFAYSQFLQAPVPGLPGIAAGSVAWGDYDNDGQLDFLVAGTIDGDFVSQLWRNILRSSNSPPGASFIALAATNLSSSPSNWSILGPPSEISPGQFQFADLEGPDYPRRFYRVHLP